MTEEESRRLKIHYFQRRVAASQTMGEPLIEKIERAFAANLDPGDENLVATAAHCAVCEECGEYFAYFAGRTWQECARDDSFRKLCGGQSFFRPLAWHYYLPAYLIQCIRHQRFSSSDFHPPRLDPDDPDDAEFRREWGQKRIDLLSAAQCRVIIDYLKITFKVWRGAAKGYEDDLTPLKFWRENYRKAAAREKR